MAYYSGVANDLGALRQALIDACVGEGWVWSPSQSVLHRDQLFVKITHSSARLDFLGRTSLTTGDMPRPVGIAQLGHGSSIVSLSWPMTFDIFIFVNEVFLVVNYGVEYYQFAAFGGSTVVDLIGTGLWVTASAKRVPSIVNIAVSGRVQSPVYSVPAPFLRARSDINNSESFIHTGLVDGIWGASTNSVASINPALVPLFEISPNSWNTEAVLLPIRVFQSRAERKVSLVADVKNARYMRIDNYEPGQIIIIGSERWKVYPFYSKNSVARNGGTDIKHSGTLGWAIRYDGP